MSTTQQYIVKKPFLLESGSQLDNVTIAYNTYGQLNAARDNVVVVCHALTANSKVEEWWGGLFGKGKVFDPEDYFIICANNLGSPYGTFSPASIKPSGKKYGLDFPIFTIRDTANLYLQFLEEIEISHIHLLIGGSCGGSIAMEMAIKLSLSLNGLALLCCSKQEMPWVVAIHESQRLALKCDTSFESNSEDAGIKGLKVARAMAMPFYRFAGSMNERQKEDSNEIITDFKSASYIRYQGEKFAKRFDPHCYFHLLNALDTHNVARGHDSFELAFSKITAKTKIIGFSSDILIPPSEQEELQRLIPNSEHLCIETDFGHDAFLIEIDQINEFVVSLLTQ